MWFDSGVFAVFITLFILVYYTIGQSWQLAWLLLGSTVFYMWSAPTALVVPFFITVVSYATAKWIDAAQGDKARTARCTTGIVILLALLVFYKYIGFIIGSVWDLARLTGITHQEAPVGITGVFASLIVPLGISYISFQAIGYMVEVKRGSLKATDNFGKYLAYILFFPKMVAGPVERAEHFLPQLDRPVSFQYGRVTSGLRQFAWGLFKKLVIADRLALFVNYVYGDLHAAQGFAPAIVFVLFPLQLYADFSGYTDMALGVARMLGYELGPNFNRPFSSLSMVEFWRRWHISLSTWFNEYYYTPIAIQKRDWGKWSMVYASLLTFLFLGLWHGPNWTFVVFGVVNACFIAAEFFTTRSRKKMRKRIPATINSIGGRVYVFLAFGVAVVFFRSAHVSDAGWLISHMVPAHINGSDLKSLLQSTGLGFMDYVILLVTIPFMFYVEKLDLIGKISHAPKWLRWSVYYVFLTVVVAYGISSGAGFIYQQF